MALLYGPPGIVKTFVIEEFIERIEKQDNPDEPDARLLFQESDSVFGVNARKILAEGIPAKERRRTALLERATVVRLLIFSASVSYLAQCLDEARDFARDSIFFISACCAIFSANSLQFCRVFTTSGASGPKFLSRIPRACLHNGLACSYLPS